MSYVSVSERYRRAVIAAMREAGGSWVRGELYAYGRAHGGTGLTFEALAFLTARHKVKHYSMTADAPERWELA